MSDVGTTLLDMIDPDLQTWLDATIERTIRWYGVYVHYSWTEHGGPAIAYTIGLSDESHPELAVANLELRTASELLNCLAARVRAGAVLGPNQRVHWDGWPSYITVEPLPEASTILVAAARRHGSPVRAYQLVYDDLSGRFPSYSGYGTHGALPWPGPPTSS